MPNSKIILVVDDDPSVHELVAAMLNGTGWKTEALASGEATMERAAKGGYDLILTDILMPGMDGLMLLDSIHARSAKAPVVVMTGVNTPARVVESLRRDASAYLSKPFSRNSLLQVLDQAMGAQFEHGDITILSDQPFWISLQVRCKMAAADRLSQFVRELPNDLTPEVKEMIAFAFRELLMNAIEHGGHLDPRKIVEISYIRTARTIVYYFRDPGEGFSPKNLPHAAVGNAPEDPYRHVEVREQMGIRPGGFGLLMTRNFADELLYSSKGNEVIFVKHLN